MNFESQNVGVDTPDGAEYVTNISTEDSRKERLPFYENTAARSTDSSHDISSFSTQTGQYGSTDQGRIQKFFD